MLSQIHALVKINTKTKPEKKEIITEARKVRNTEKIIE